MKFDELNLNKSLLKSLEDLGFTTATTIQSKVFPVVMSGKDVYGIAQTGTGKTFAYLLPCLRLFQFSKEKSPQLVILVPTRELVVQVVESVKQLTTYMNLLVVGVYGGVNFKPQVAEVSNGVDILVATPGRLVNLLSSGVVKPKSVKRLVLDEADEMLNLGFRAQLKLILDTLPERRQNLLFSATITDEVEALMNSYFESPVRVEATPVGTQRRWCQLDGERSCAECAMERVRDTQGRLVAQGVFRQDAATVVRIPSSTTSLLLLVFEDPRGPILLKLPPQVPGSSTAVSASAPCSVNVPARRTAARCRQRRQGWPCR